MGRLDCVIAIVRAKFLAPTSYSMYTCDMLGVMTRGINGYMRFCVEISRSGRCMTQRMAVRGVLIGEGFLCSLSFAGCSAVRPREGSATNE